MYIKCLSYPSEETTKWSPKIDIGHKQQDRNYQQLRQNIKN